MDFSGIDSVVFGADDLKLARKLLSDWGLAKVSSTNIGIVYATGNGAQVIVHHTSAQAQAPSTTSAPLLRGA